MNIFGNAITARLLAFRRALKVRELVDAGLPAAAALHWAESFDHPGRETTVEQRQKFAVSLQLAFGHMLACEDKFEVAVSSRAVHSAVLVAAVDAGLVDADSACQELAYSLPHGTMTLEGEVLFFRTHGRSSALWFANQLARIMHQQQSTQPDWMQSLSPQRLFASRA